MSPEAIKAIKERLELGYKEEEIKAEFLQAGYDEDAISSMLTQARVNSDTVQPVPAPVQLSLPGVYTLVVSSLKYVVSRWDLFLLVSIPAVFVAVIALVTGVNTLEPGMPAEPPLAVTIASFVNSVLTIIISIMAFYIVAFSKERRVNFTEAYNWVKTHGFAFLWVGILAYFAVLGGFMLLVIPGIIVSTYLVFSHLVLVREEHKGMDALIRSRALVYGKWWDVWGKLFGTAVIFGLASIIVMAVLILPMFFFASQTGVAISVFLVNIIRSFLALATLHILVSLYEALKVPKPVFQPALHTEALKKYKRLAWLGLAFPILLIFLAIILASLNSAREQGLEAQQMRDAYQAQLQTETEGSESSAAAQTENEEFSTESTVIDSEVNSTVADVRQTIESIRSRATSLSGYSAVCDDIEVKQLLNTLSTAYEPALRVQIDRVSGFSTITCNDSAEGYAIAAPVLDGERGDMWCGDAINSTEEYQINEILSPFTDVSCK
jgi:hypothetical protein